jgi:hypothetical protein
MMVKGNKHNILLGIAVLACVVIILVATPGSFLSPVTFIDSELYQSSDDKVPVRTNTDFGNAAALALLPYEIGQWDGYDYDTAEYIESLGADLVLLRGYLPDTSGDELFLTINQAKTESSIHDPPYCYRAEGYEIEEESEERVTVTDARWVKGSTAVSLPVKKLVALKTSSEGKVLDRRVALYCYVKGNQFYSDTVTMIKTETLAPLDGSSEDSVSELQAFLAQAVPLMFSPNQSNSQWRPLALTLTEWGIGGWIILAVLIIIPMGIILYPIIRRRNI